MFYFLVDVVNSQIIFCETSHSAKCTLELADELMESHCSYKHSAQSLLDAMLSVQFCERQFPKRSQVSAESVVYTRSIEKRCIALIVILWGLCLCK